MTSKEKTQFNNLCRKLQEKIFDNKKTKGFNIDNVPLEFCLTSGELAEAFDAWRKGKKDLPEEIADVVIYSFGLSAILDIDLGKEIIKKTHKNKKREYRKTKGILLKK